MISGRLRSSGVEHLIIDLCFCVLLLPLSTKTESRMTTSTTAMTCYAGEAHETSDTDVQMRNRRSFSFLPVALGSLNKPSSAACRPPETLHQRVRLADGRENVNDALARGDFRLC